MCLFVRHVSDPYWFQWQDLPLSSTHLLQVTLRSYILLALKLVVVVFFPLNSYKSIVVLPAESVLKCFY